jgi:hypothetical protein
VNLILVLLLDAAKGLKNMEMTETIARLDNLDKNKPSANKTDDFLWLKQTL